MIDAMSVDGLTCVDIAAFCASREVDLVFRGASPPLSFVLHGEFDGYGDFFTIEVGDVEYVDCPGTFAVRELRLLEDRRTLGELAAKWQRVGEEYGAPTLVMRSDDVGGWNDPRQHAYALVIANRITFRPGADWNKGPLAPWSANGDPGGGR